MDLEQMDMARLAGRVAVVTGAAGGLGSAVCEDLVLSGLKVAAIDCNRDGLQVSAYCHQREPPVLFQLSRDILNRGGLMCMTQALERKLGPRAPAGSLHTLLADVAKEAELKPAFQWVEDNLGAVAVVVNNAGIAPMSSLEGR